MTAKVHANTYVSLMSGPLTLVIIFKSPIDWLGAATIRGTFLDNTQAYINILMQYNQIASIHVKPKVFNRNKLTTVPTQCLKPASCATSMPICSTT